MRTWEPVIVCLTLRRRPPRSSLEKFQSAQTLKARMMTKGINKSQVASMVFGMTSPFTGPGPHFRLLCAAGLATSSGDIRARKARAILR
jgi:hypothetical protein